MAAYYNENDPKAAAWLRELIRAKLIAYGVVDERSIADVKPVDLAGFTQCHFFAGIGGWSYALRLAGWSDDRRVWTGSCPCQPFSAAGEGRGFADERHLWPAWFHLISQCRPETVFGEQVAAKLGWWDLVRSDFNNQGYAAGAVIIPAASAGAPHIRERLYWVANTFSERRQQITESTFSDESANGWKPHGHNLFGSNGKNSMEHAESEQAGIPGLSRESRGTGAVGNSDEQQLDGRWDFGERRRTELANAGFWDDCEWIECTDGKARPIEPGTFPLAHGIPGRVGLLRGYGNAITPQVAAAFVMAYLAA